MKKIFFYCSVCLLITLFIFSCFSNGLNVTYINTNTLTTIDYNEIISTRKEVENDIDIYYDGTVIPYNANDNYYLINIDDIDKLYTILGYNIGVLENSLNTLRIILYDNYSYKLSTVYLTNLPVLSIITKKVGSKNNTGSLTIHNSLDNNSYNIKYRVRGSSSKIYFANNTNTKPSYKLEITSSTNKQSLLGMKESNDWVLNSLWLDKSYIRERIGFELWNSLNGEYLMHMKPVELLIDGEYKGIYALQEKITLDTFNATKDDLLISTKYWRNDVKNKKIYDESYKFSKNIDEFEIEEGITSQDMQRKLILALLDSIEKTSNSDFKVSYDNKSNGDYNLFINLVLAIDNRYKNEKILFRYQDSGYVIYKMPWDLDWSINNESVSAKTDINAIYADGAIPAHILKDSNFKEYQKQKYFDLRNTVYNDEYLNNLIETYADDLRDSGALERTNSSLEFEKSIRIVKAFFKERIKILDEYYGGL